MRISDWSSDVCSSDLRFGRAFGAYFIRRLAEGERFALGDQVRHQQAMLITSRLIAAALNRQGVERLAEADEVARHDPRALVQQLVERMLAVGARLAPVDRKSTRLNSSH